MQQNNANGWTCTVSVLVSPFAIFISSFSSQVLKALGGGSRLEGVQLHFWSGRRLFVSHRTSIGVDRLITCVVKIIKKYIEKYIGLFCFFNKKQECLEVKFSELIKSQHNLLNR